MRFLPLALVLPLVLPLTCAAQVPLIGTLDLYGVRKVSESRIRQTLGVKPGDPLPPSKGDTEERLDAIPGVVESHLEAVCCDEGKVILYVGIEERGAAHFDIRDNPDGEMRLPEEVASAYSQFQVALEAAVRRGSTAEDLTQGHSLMADPDARAIQAKFPDLAKEHLAALRDVLRNSGDEEQRAIAATVIGYAPRKADVMNDLQYALKDADSVVRANAARSLTAFAILGRLDAAQNLRVQPTWFIEMLNSLSWTDRTRALAILQVLTDVPDASTLEQLRDRAMPALTEMARWKTLAHALPAYLLLGRIAGLADVEVQSAWSKGDRESVITSAIKKKK